MTYNQEAEQLERDLAKKYPRLTWHVMRDEEWASKECNGDLDRWYWSYATQFIILCTIPELNWRAQYHADKEAWTLHTEWYDRLLGSIAYVIMRYLQEYLLSDEKAK